MSPKSTTETDEVVGALIRRQREGLGLSQSAVAQRLGISTQQVQKYEAGKNRISASKLHSMSKALGVEISCFFDEPEVGQDSPILPDVFLELSTAFSRIKGRKLRRALLALIERMSDLR